MVPRGMLGLRVSMRAKLTSVTYARGLIMRLNTAKSRVAKYTSDGLLGGHSGGCQKYI